MHQEVLLRQLHINELLKYSARQWFEWFRSQHHIKDKDLALDIFCQALLPEEQSKNLRSCVVSKDEKRIALKHLNKIKTDLECDRIDSAAWNNVVQNSILFSLAPGGSKNKETSDKLSSDNIAGILFLLSLAKTYKVKIGILTSVEENRLMYRLQCGY